MSLWNTVVFVLGVGTYTLFWSGIGWVMEYLWGLPKATFYVGLLGLGVGVLIWIIIFNYCSNRRSEE